MSAKRIEYAPGMRLIIRDEEWLTRRVDATSDGGRALRVVGVSSLTRGQTRVFLTSLEKKIEIVDPLNTRFALDSSQKYRNSRVFIEQILRRATPTDDRIYLGAKAAIDPIPYQFDPTLKALNEPRPRILIADSVGLGKTIECGILLSELIKRGRGKRILVLAVKSMLTQFQKELWARFAIPLVRLDSIGIQRVRNHIPTNQNPFYFYDKTIISIDTLKNELEYRNYLENSYWDVVVIDEAHNVADRSGSQRSRLARLISKRSDALIMLSATPHDGSKRSFASLMTALEPTAIADPENYGPDDIQGLFVRRFKKDVKDQIRKAFPERIVSCEKAKATFAEEEAFSILSGLKFQYIDRRRKSGDFLFKTTLEKALFSSPAACRETIRHRLANINKAKEKTPTPELEKDAKTLRELDARLAEIEPASFAKYRLLLDYLRPGKGKSGWSPKQSDDRVVIFTERVETLKFLKERLEKDLKLPENSVVSLRGDLGDAEIARIVEDFGIETSKTRILVCTDVASEGINLHYLCRRLIHFDVPWSLTTFQQRNGRIDRYGQEKRPEIVYFLTESADPKIRGDARYLELLVEKDRRVVESIGDPTEFTRCYDVEAEELQVGEAIEANKTAEEFGAEMEARYDAAQDDDPLAALMASVKPTAQRTFDAGADEPTLFKSDFEYAREALEFVNSVVERRNRTRAEGEPREQKIKFDADPRDRTIVLTPNDAMKARLKRLPPEIFPEEQIRLCDRVDAIKKEFAKCRTAEKNWPTIQFLWNLHPVLEYLNDLAGAAFGRMKAPAVVLPPERLAPNETLYLVSALVPDRQGRPVVFEQRGILTRDGEVVDSKPLEFWIDKLKLKDDDWNNSDAEANADELQKLDARLDDELRAPLKDVVARIKKDVADAANVWLGRTQPKLDEQRARLTELKRRRLSIVQREFEFMKEIRRNKAEEDFERNKREIEEIFSDFNNWVESEAVIEKDAPSIRIIAALKGAR